MIYLANHSLGCCTAAAKEHVFQAVGEWESLAVKGWSDPEADWFHLAEKTAGKLGKVVGAVKESVAVTGTTTSNLHQLLATFCDRDSSGRNILVDEVAFPTDRYAIESVLTLLDGNAARLQTISAADDGLLSEDHIIAAMTDNVGLVLLPSVVYLTGQLLDVRRLVNAAHERNVIIGLDCSHSVGIVDLPLDDIGPDFAVFSTYKYLSGGPGSMAGLYVHRRHAERLPALTGWFGCDKSRQFRLEPTFHPAADAGRFQIGTPHILSLVALQGALDEFVRRGISSIRRQSLELTDRLIACVDQQLVEFGVRVVTPREHHRRGGHLTLRINDSARVSKALREAGVVGDFRPPDLIRLGPSPLFNSSEDCERAVEILADILRRQDFRSLADNDLVT